MAYGLLLYKEITSPEGTHRLEVHKDGYTGQAVEIDGLVRDSIVLSKNAGEVSDAIVTSVLSFGLYDTGQIDYTQFFTPYATLFKVVLKLDGVTRWTGFLTPDSFSENLAYRDIITLTARDNLGRLNDYDFSLGREQLLSVRNIITAGLSVAGVAMQATFSTTKVASDPATILAVDGLVNTSLLVGRSWHEALDLLLRGLGLTLSWNEGNTFDVRDISQAPATTQAAYFIGKSGYRQKRPAWKNVAVSQDFGLRDNFYEGQFSREQCGTGNTFAPSGKWEATGTMALLNPYKYAAANPAEMVFVPIQEGETISAAMTYTFHAPSMAKAIKLVCKCSNSAWRAGSALRGGVWAQRKIVTGQSHGQDVSRYYFLRYSFNIFATVGTTRYILRETWEEYDPATLAEPYLYFVMPGSEGGIDEDNEVTFYIAGLPGAADIEFVVYPVIAQLSEDGAAIETLPNDNYGRLSDITFTVQEGIAGRSKLVTVNADHNVQSDLSFALGAVPRSNGNELVYLGGLFYTDADHTPIREAALAAGGTEYDLLELVAREHIGFNNDNYDLLSGQMKAAAAFSFAAGILYGGTAYRVISASLAVLSNTLNVQAMQTEAAFPTAAYVIGEVDEAGGASAGGYSGGSVPQGNFGGVDWFVKETYEEDGETKQRLKLNPAYTGMYAEGWITAGGLNSGSEPGGGGSLATLADVTLTDLAAGDILRYSATTSHWENVQPTLALLTDVALGTPTDGQALIWDATLGRWRPGTVQGGGGIGSVGLTMPTGFVVAGSPLRSDGTLQVSFASGYALPTTADVANGATAYGWGNHANAGYLTTDTADGRYAAGFNYSSGKLYLVDKNGSVLTNISGGNLATAIGTAAVNRATNDANGNTIASQSWVTARGYLTSVEFGDLTSHPTTLAGYGITDAKISGGTITLGGNTITPLASVAFADLTSHPTTLSGYGITDAKISGGTITLGANTLTPLTDVSVVSGDNTIGTSLTTIGQVHGVNIRAKIAAYLLAADFTASNIVSTLGTTAVNRATADASGNTITSSYLRKDTDDTMSANLTIGQANLSGSKTLTIYGRNNDTTPALTIYGVASATTRYATKIYRDSTALQIGSSVSITGNIIATGYIDAGYGASDRRLKKDIKTMDLAEAAHVLAALRPVTFAWNEKASELGPFSGDSRGFIADEYNCIIGNATRKMWGEYDAIDYHQVIPYLVAGWQLQQQRIEALAGEIEKLRRRLGDGI